MMNLIRADLRRITRKKSWFVIIALLILLQVKDLISAMDQTSEEILAHEQNMFGGTYLLIATIFIFLAVFGNDATANIAPSIIGRGISRGKYIGAKVIDSVVLLLILYTVTTLVKQFIFRAAEVPLTDRQFTLLIVYNALMLFKGISCLSFSVLAQMVTGSNAIGVITDVVMCIFAGTILKLVKTFYQIDLFRYITDGLLNSAFSNITVGNVPWQIIPVVLVYIVGVSVAAWMVFQKKELEL